MAGLKESPRRSASRSGRKISGKTAPASVPAQSLTHKPADRAGKRTWSPKELAFEMEQALGAKVSPRTITARCNLPVGHPGRIATLPGFFGRHVIPAAEVMRLLAAEGCA